MSTNADLVNGNPALTISHDDPTDDAQTIWAIVFPDEPWPLGARVKWVPYLRGLYGVIRNRREILISRAAHKTNEEAVDTLIHELVHLRGYGRHNATFYRVENECRARLGLTPMPDERAKRRAHREEKKRRATAALAEWQEKYGRLPTSGDEVILLTENRKFPAGIWGTIIDVRGSRVEVRWGVTNSVWAYWHRGLRSIRPTGRKRSVKGKTRVLSTASVVIPIPDGLMQKQAV